MPDILGAITGGLSGLLGKADQVIDELTVSDSEKSEAKAKLSGIVLDGLNRMLETQASVIKAEASGGFLQRNWRPIMMLTFTVLLVIRWTGLSSHPISETLELELLEIVKLGLGGYVVGRSVEKVADKFSQNIDLPFIRKKDRRI